MPTADHFTAVASQYAAFRPDYPAELFDWLTSLVPQRLQAWDCGAGSGQATVQLASRFEQVLATDISAAQLAAAPAMPNVTARVAPAEDCGLPDYSLDLVTVAQAMHWFDLDTFYAEVRRVLRPRGVIAVWGYNRLSLPQPEVQRRLDDFYEGSIGPYWPAERIHVENSYRDLSFPFTRIEPPAFALCQQWTRDQLFGYLRSWSAVARFRSANGFDPVDSFAADIAAHWPEEVQLTVTWPLFLLVGRID
ncbi:MAG: class I SAM-dependent methyltransferase [Sideroxydans sp.]|nr:class I SAM-dependent methyltransferase [Sideroxydans sp.]